MIGPGRSATVLPAGRTPPGPGTVIKPDDPLSWQSGRAATPFY